MDPERFQRRFQRFPGFQRFRRSGSALAAIGLLYGVAASQTTGGIEGRVRFEGTPPADVFVPESGVTQKTLHVGPTGGLQYVVVYLPDATSASRSIDSAAHVDQRRFVFVPPVIAVRAGQPVRFTNADVANHNVRATDPVAENTFALETSGGDASGKVRRFAAPRPTRPIRLSCDIHPWMAAWVYVFDHDDFAVTDADGRFRIPDVPPGSYRVSVRQPGGRLAREMSVDVTTRGPGRLEGGSHPRILGCQSGNSNGQTDFSARLNSPTYTPCCSRSGRISCAPCSRRKMPSASLRVRPALPVA